MGRGTIVLDIVSIRKYFYTVIIGFAVTFIFAFNVSAQSVAENIRPVSQVCLSGQACVGTIADSRSEEELTTTEEEPVDSEQATTSLAELDVTDNIGQLTISADSGAVYEVQMLNQGADGVMVFEPSVLHVRPGDSVTFKATDLGHNAASIEGMIPAGAESWDSGMSQDVTVTFGEEGTYVYQCTPHLMMAMVGVIIVGDSNINLAAIKDAAADKKASFLMEQNRLDAYLEGL